MKKRGCVRERKLSVGRKAEERNECHSFHMRATCPEKMSKLAMGDTISINSEIILIYLPRFLEVAQ